ncbi:MAG: glycosyltransferase family 2 protein [Rhodobacteraceae bacterium]|nr:glycosyltransferase family 2 protein [Paracoccaceae bacterium]
MPDTALPAEIAPADIERLRKSPLFDAEWYLKTYPDVAMLGMDPAEHYLKYGKMMGRDPGPGERPQAGAAAVRDAPADVGLPEVDAFIASSLAAYKGKKAFPSIVSLGDLPLVSVVMTAFDCADTIERAVLSLVMQSWPQIEVVVCDDRSRDGTWEILETLRRRSPGVVKIVRLGTNSGTYIAKNVAAAEARGDIVLFQDSDDYSHPDRVLVSVLPLLAQPELIATRTQYARFDPDTGRVIRVGELMSKLGLITLAVRARAFREVGYFDAVRKAGDDEWFQRLRHLYGRRSVADLGVTLYAAELRQESLASDMLTRRDDGSVTQSSSSERHDYVETFQKRFADKSRPRSWYRTSFPPVPKAPAAAYPPSLRVLSGTRLPVFASLCSIPSRVEKLAQVVGRILPQVDHLTVYLDKYDTVPEFLTASPAITVRRSAEFDTDFRDNAKFLDFDERKKTGTPFHYLTLDDDIVYPHDYVRTLVDRLDAFDNRVIAGVHGVVCEEQPSAYFRNRFIYHYRKDALAAPRLVNNLGTGTACFHDALFDTLDPRRWPLGGMVDIFLSLEARRRNIPMLAIDRHAGWLRDFEGAREATTLFSEFRDKERIMLDHLETGAPWGYRAILDAVAAQPAPLARRLRALLPAFPEAVSVTESFDRMRG